MENYKFDTGIITKERIQLFIKYLQNEETTDVDWNGRDLWVKNIHNVKIKIPHEEHGITDEYIKVFTSHLATSVNKLFNREHCELEAETLDFRFTCVYESRALSGRTCIIRKVSRKVRMSYKYLIDTNYTQEPILNLLINCSIAKCNFMIGGNPGIGKTEFGKLLSLYIANWERVITLEDSPEWHYSELKPEADCIEIKVDEENFTYTDALKACLRLNASRIFLSEVRSVEAKSLIECWSTGVKGTSTIHCDSVREIPDRILNMMPTRADAERLENNVYTYLDIGVLINTKISEEGREYRFIEEVCFFERNPVTKKNKVYMIVEDGQLIKREIPERIKKKLLKVSVTDFFGIEDEIKEKYYETK